MWFIVDAVLSSSVPRTEIVGKGDYFRFSERDSLALEASFLEVTISAHIWMPKCLVRNLYHL
jgi:hypothetical protein